MILFSGSSISTKLSVENISFTDTAPGSNPKEGATKVRDEMCCDNNDSKQSVCK